VKFPLNNLFVVSSIIPACCYNTHPDTCTNKQQLETIDKNKNIDQYFKLLLRGNKGIAMYD